MEIETKKTATTRTTTSIRLSPLNHPLLCFSNPTNECEDTEQQQQHQQRRQQQQKSIMPSETN